MRKHMWMVMLVSLMVLWWGIIPAWAQAPYRWSMIRMGGKEINNTLATGTNDAGWVVGNWWGHADPTDPGSAFRFQKNKFTAFAIPGAAKTDPADIDQSTRIVGNFTLPDGNIHAFFYRHGNPPANDIIDVPGAFWTFAYRVNSKKQIALGYFWSPDGISTVWTAAIFDWNTKQLTPITIDGAADLVIRGLNKHGETVGSFTVLDENNPCLCQFWDNGFYRSADGEVVHLTAPDGGSLFPSSINDHGIVVGQTWWGTGFRWDLNTGVFEDIPHPSRQEGFWTAIMDIDNQGRMVAINERASDGYTESWWLRPQ